MKLFLTSQGLALRRRKEELFLRGEYHPLETSGSAAGHLVAFARSLGSDVVVAVAPRLITSLTGFDQGLPLGSVWGDTEVDLSEFQSHPFQNEYTGQTVSVGPTGRVSVAKLFDSFPVALLVLSADA